MAIRFAPGVGRRGQVSQAPRPKMQPWDTQECIQNVSEGFMPCVAASSHTTGSLSASGLLMLFFRGWPSNLPVIYGGNCDSNGVCYVMVIDAVVVVVKDSDGKRCAMSGVC